MTPRVTLVAGLGYGDEGKGTITEYLAVTRGAKTVVRYNGGAQAAHNVVMTDGRHHTFSQFGSATLHGVKTFLSKHVLVDPLALMAEAKHLQKIGVPNALDLVSIDQDALLITPYHRYANRAKEELRGEGRHGSCGIGVGETMADSIAYGRNNVPTIGDLRRGYPVFHEKMEFIRRKKLEEFHGIPGPWMDNFRKPFDLVAYMPFNLSVAVVGSDHMKKVLDEGPIIFEGAQGILLDQDFGFQPYTTWTDITFKNAYSLLTEAGFGGSEPAERIGVLRTYHTRHGRGPFPSEYAGYNFKEIHNCTGDWQEGFRRGYLDIMVTQYALRVIGGVDSIAMTHMDIEPPGMCSIYYVPPEYADMFDYGIAVKKPFDMAYQERLAKALFNVKPTICNFDLDELCDRVRTPISIYSYGPTLQDKFTEKMQARDLQITGT